MNYKFIFGLFLIALFVFSISAPVHHGTNISYDHSKTVVFKAIVTEFRYSRFSSGTAPSGKSGSTAGKFPPTRIL